MKNSTPQRRWMLAVAVVSAIAGGAAQAEKPSWAEKPNKHEKHAERDRQDSRVEQRDGGRELRFAPDYHRVVRDFYVQEQRSGKCPPGLAKKRNGCMPPGQARKWTQGQPLPHGVVIYDLPPELVVRIGLPPSGYRYARVGADILMIAIGTNLVIDAIADLGGR